MAFREGANTISDLEMSEKSPDARDLEDQKTDPLTPIETVQEGDDKERSLVSKLSSKVFARVEARGIAPVPVEERTDSRAYSLFALWFTANFSLLPYVESVSL